MVDSLSATDCGQVSVFLDAAHRGLSVDLPMSVRPTPLDDGELEQSIVGWKHAVCFSSSRHGEESHSSAHLKHGIWTHHVLEALRGTAAAALLDARCVTSASLQHYLSRAVPRPL